MCVHGFVHGTIVKGDYEKVASLYRNNHRTLTDFYLLSPGGDAKEAMKIGRLFRRYLIKAGAPFEKVCGANEQCVCASACALIWFGGIQRTGRVGLHRPRTMDARFKTMAPADASVAYKGILDEISHYLEEMEAPRTAIDAMVATSSSQITWVEYYRDGFWRPPSIYEWISASCGAFTESELMKRFELELDKERAGLSQSDQMLLQFLDKKISAIDQCELILVHSSVDRLPPPPETSP